ncbi:MAG: AI-2E family transporter [Nitrospira sp.]|nr:AI-2E family transporter [Nitrospira sp.]
MSRQAGYLMKIAVVGIIVIAGIALLTAVSNIVKMVIISALLAYIIDPLANFLESRGMGRTSATVAIFAAFFVFIGFSYMAFLPLLSEQIYALQRGFSLEKAGIMISRLEDFLLANLSFLGVKDLNLLSRLENAMASTGGWIFDHFLDTASVITSMILIPFIIFFLMKDGREFKKAFVSAMPNQHFEFTLYLFYKLNAQIGNYLRGQFIDATIVGVLSAAALWFIGVKYFFIIGIFAGLANLIPYFGPVAGATVAVIVSILQTGNFQMAFYVIIAFTLIKLIDDVLIQPVVVARTVHMHPLVVLLSVLVGGKLFGILGMLLSVPIVGFLKVVAQESINNYRRYREI